MGILYCQQRKTGDSKNKMRQQGYTLYAIVLLIEVCQFGNVKTLGPHKIVKFLNFSATQNGVQNGHF